VDYGKILARAFEITRKYRALWLFGVLAALCSGGNANVNVGNWSVGDGSGRGRGGDSLPTLPPDFWQVFAIIVLVALCVILILFLLSIVLRFISRAALIGLVQELEASGTTPTVRRGFRIGADRFWSLLGIALAVNIPLWLFSFAALGVAALPLIMSLLPLIGAGKTSADELLGVVLTGVFGSLALLCCVILFLVLIGLVITPFYEFIVRACVVGKRGVMDSMREGFRVVRANLGNVAVLYILLIGIGIGFALLMIPVALILIGVPVGVGIAIGVAANSAAPGIVAGVLIGIPMLLILLFIAGLYETFRSTAWTEGYLALTAPAT